MRSFLLLIFSLMTGCGASFEVKGCSGGWIEFTCKYPKQSKKYESIVVYHPKTKPKRTSQKDRWVTTDIMSLYHDTKNKQVKVVIKQLREEDFGDYNCKFNEKKESSEEDEGKTHKVKVLKRHNCRGPFLQTAYRTARTTITCDYPENEYKSSVRFFCKEKTHSICEDISSTESSPESNGTFSLTETNSSFSMSISDVSSEDAGVYWCGVKSKDGSYRTALRKIRLEVENITDLMRFPTVGQTFTFSCEYLKSISVIKLVCKGEDPSICKSLVSTSLKGDTGKFSIKDKKAGNMTITVKDITLDDTGTYWCGDRSTDKRRSNLFFNRLTMTVEQPHPTTFVSSTDVSESADSNGFLLPVIIAAVVCVTVLVLVLIVVLVCKGFDRTKTTDKEVQNKEDGAYEEIQELPPKPQPGTAMKTIYATANVPTYPFPAPHHTSYINFQHRSAVVGAKTHPTARDNNQHPTYSTVNPFYSTVNMPKQH